MDNSTLNNPTNVEVFDLYHSKLLWLSSKYDFTLNIYEDDRDEFLNRSASDFFQNTFSSAFRRLDEFEKPPSLEKKFIRMTARALELTQKRDEQIISTIWKVTEQLRRLIDSIKRQFPQ